MNKFMCGCIIALFICFTNFTATAHANIFSTQETQTMTKKEFTLKVPNENRKIYLRFTLPQNTETKLPQLVIIATGLYSQMDKPSQVKLAKNYQDAGFATLQFNFMAHGKDKNKSDGKIQDVTLSSGIQDLKTVWNYAKKNLSNKVNTDDIVIAANSYGALVSLAALEKNIISPESMVLTAPLSLEKYKHWILPLRLMVALMPKLASKIFNASPNMMWDFLKNHTKLMTKKNLLGNTAVYFLSGSKDKIAPHSDIKKWCKKFNSQQPDNVAFVNNVQAQYKIYNNVKHFNIPENVSKDMHKRSIDFIKKTHSLKS